MAVGEGDGHPRDVAHGDLNESRLPTAPVPFHRRGQQDDGPSTNIASNLDVGWPPSRAPLPKKLSHRDLRRHATRPALETGRCLADGAFVGRQSVAQRGGADHLLDGRILREPHERARAAHMTGRPVADGDPDTWWSR